MSNGQQAITEERRKARNLTMADIQALASVLKNLTPGSMTSEEHRASHEAIKSFIDRENTRAANSEALWKKLTTTVIVSTAVSVCSGVGYVVIIGIKVLLKTL
jgi:hypothetical protein